MPNALRLVAALLLPLSVSVSYARTSSSPRVVQDFDNGWRFSWTNAQAEQPAFDDSAWTTVSVPHDASIAGPIDKANPSGPAGGFFPTGVVWYRKSFTVPAVGPGHRAYIAFDGVMANSDVWINGFHLGHRPSGTVSFHYDLTDHLKSGANILAVRCDTSKQPASRWYEGLGIYRSVRLILTGDQHIEPWSTFITTPAVSADHATVHVQTDVANDSSAAKNLAIAVTLITPDGHALREIRSTAQSAAPHASTHFIVDIPVDAPQRWDLDSPKMYLAKVRVLEGTRTLDNEEQPFGIREFHFDAATGFWLNGRNFKVKGAAVHIDGGAVGIAVPMAVWEQRLNEMRKLGVNAIRTAHNPASPEFLDLCDRMGFLVMDEMFDCWTVGKTPFDYHLDFNERSLIDLRDTVQRDRNHPSIILYSAGNEIHDTPKAELAHRILVSLVDEFHKNDPTRPVTQALFRPNVSHDYNNGLADLLDVVGQNYREQEILAAHAQKPTRKIIGTENTHDRNQWVAMRDNAEYSGQFLWVGVDYLGEAGVWPLTTNGAGLLNRDAEPNPRGYERQSWWATTPMVRIVRRIAADDKVDVDPGYEAVPPRFHQSLFADWTPRNTTPHSEKVEVYTNAEEVELLLNGASLGRQPLHADATPLKWDVPYAPGKLEAVAYNKGQRVAQDDLRTAAQPARIILRTSRKNIMPDRNNLAFIYATVVDTNGVVVPQSSNLIHFAVSGGGQVAGVDNGSLVDHDPFPATDRHAFEGHALALVRSTQSKGSISITASSDGLTSSTVTLTTAPAPAAAYTRSF
jgi:beta-galactosidase